MMHGQRNIKLIIQHALYEHYSNIVKAFECVLQNGLKSILLSEGYRCGLWRYLNEQMSPFYGKLVLATICLKYS